MNRFFADIKKYAAYIAYATKSELQAEVANSYLNWLWWILEPLCFMGIYAFIFSMFSSSKLAYLTAFIFLGITAWEFFNKLLTVSVSLVRSNKPIVSKVYLPKYVLLLEKMLLNGFKTAINFVIVILLMLVYRVPLTVQTLWFLPVLLSFVIFTFGVCSIFLHFGVYVEDLTNATKIGLRLVFYTAGVFYNLTDKLASAVGYWLLRLNPIAMYINDMRNTLLYGTAPNLVWLGLWTVVGIALSIGGVLMIQKNENNYVKVL